MIKYYEGDIFKSEVEALVNTVNTEGVMGKGIALGFKEHYKDNHRLYKDACKLGKVKVGKLFITEDISLEGKRTIINFATKDKYKERSEYRHIETGLQELNEVLGKGKIKSLAMPLPGAGNGKLDPHKIKALIEKYLKESECHISVYSKYVNTDDVDIKHTPLTPARAMLLRMMGHQKESGNFISLFSATIFVYLLSRNGASEIFNMSFTRGQYGPYSDSIRHLLYSLQDSYIIGYHNKDAKPLEALGLIEENENDAKDFLDKSYNNKFLDIVNKTHDLIKDYYDELSLSHIASIDYLNQENHNHDIEYLTNELHNWHHTSQRDRQFQYDSIKDAVDTCKHISA